MDADMHNLLVDRLIRIIDDHGTIAAASLPEVLSALVAGQVESFADLRAHQSHAWHALLVQLAAMAMHRAKLDHPPNAAEDWCGLLRGLTPDHPDDAPWHLVVEDWTKPAFLQPPAPPQAVADYRGPLTEPDQIDLLVTAKNHDVKASRIAAASPAHWLFALTALQTMEGFLGAGNYGVSRMNGGFASRPCLGLAPSTRPDAHFRRDLAVMLARRDDWFRRWPFFRRNGGMALVWLLPWSGGEQIELEPLDPWYIEICRRTRLRGTDRGIVAMKAGSKCSRIAAATYKGNIGDPWTPIDTNEGKALSLTAAGFSYDRLQDLLFGTGWEPSPLQRFTPGVDGEQMVVIARGLARGQGQTAGYHERVLPIPASAKRRLIRDGGPEGIGAIARRRVDEVAEAGRKVLWPALLALHNDGNWAGRWRDTLDRAVDAEFFPLLWDEVGADDTMPPQRAWRQRLLELTEQTFKEAMRAVPRVASRDYKIIAHAEGLFRALARKHFADLETKPIEEIA